MSANADRPGREVAYRLFAAEYDDATLSHTESDEERAPNYVITPTGARVNRLFVVGTLTEVTRVNDEMVRARVVDPTGAFVVYAGQYQPDQLAFLERAEPPLFVAVTGKARTFQPEDSDRVYTSVRPESIATVDADTRDRWVVGAAEQTLDRIAAYARAAELDVYGDDLAEALREGGLENGLANGIPLAQDHYGTTPAYLDALADVALDAVRVVAGERDQVRQFDRRPDESATGAPSFAELAELGDLEVAPSVPSEAAAAESAAEPAVAPTADAESEQPSTADAESEQPSTADSPAEATAATDAGTAPDDSSASTVESGAGAEVDTGTEPDLEAAAETEAETEPATETTFDESTDVAEREDDADDLGDFESGGLGSGMYEMDDDEREQLEEEFGAEFSTGAEVDEPGEADIDVPEPEADPSPDADTEPAAEDDGVEAPDLEEATAAETTVDEDPSSELEESAEPAEDESADDAATDANVEDGDEDESEDEEAADAGEDLEDVDLQEYVVETMTELDDGDGADREAVVSTVVEETGAAEEAVEEAIQGALMGGQCYEPDDETLKAI